MEAFFGTPLLFWYGFVFSFLICTGLCALVQCWFLLHFCGVESRVHYYLVYVLISYLLYLLGVFSRFPLAPMLDTVMGVGILWLFSNRLLKQNPILSAIAAALTMAVTTLVESLVFLLEYLNYQVLGASQTLSLLINGPLLFLLSLVMYQFFVARYSVKSRCQSKNLLAFAVPILFISIMLRTVNTVRYTTTSGGIVLQSDRITNYEAVIITVGAFLCVCIVLFAYEKTIEQMETERKEALFQAQLVAQQTYVAQAKQKYETTKAFRHDFKNHILALQGLLKLGEADKAAAYLERFERIYQEMTFPVQTGNSLLDTLLGEKLAYAGQLGIRSKCEIAVPSNLNIDDFDLCTVFANAIDNAINACAGAPAESRVIDIAAKANGQFFIVDMVNHYQPGNVPHGSGMGLTAIGRVAEKYQGAVEICDADGLFRLSVLLPFQAT